MYLSLLSETTARVAACSACALALVHYNINEFPPAIRRSLKKGQLRSLSRVPRLTKEISFRRLSKRRRARQIPKFFYFIKSRGFPSRKYPGEESRNRKKIAKATYDLMTPPPTFEVISFYSRTKLPSWLWVVEATLKVVFKYIIHKLYRCRVRRWNVHKPDRFPS